jgi:hypothetical protein
MSMKSASLHSQCPRVAARNVVLGSAFYSGGRVCDTVFISCSALNVVYIFFVFQI